MTIFNIHVWYSMKYKGVKYGQIFHVACMGKYTVSIVRLCNKTHTYLRPKLYIVPPHGIYKKAGLKLFLWGLGNTDIIRPN